VTAPSKATGEDARFTFDRRGERRTANGMKLVVERRAP